MNSISRVEIGEVIDKRFDGKQLDPSSYDDVLENRSLLVPWPGKALIPGLQCWPKGINPILSFSAR
ncbi:MAG: hypothetical protein DRO11_04720 [Methanobacteriota archaeon]|nr:MAG: hypothetical protein DRO11_04720 [Euryarchaeota archaeon]